MKERIKSIFNLIEIFGNSKNFNVKPLNEQTHCEQKHHHDFYCDAEKPFVSY